MAGAREAGQRDKVLDFIQRLWRQQGGACPSADWRPEGRRELGRQGAKKPGKSLGKWRGQTEVVKRSVRPASHSFLL